MPDPIQIIETIIANAIDTANEHTDNADAAAEKLIRKSAGFYLDPPDSSARFAVEAVEPDIPEVTDGLITYEAQLDKVVALLSSQLAGFFAQYYPLESDAFDEATNWLVNTITNGGTGINKSVEDQLWQRARDRVIADGRRVENQIIVGYAAKGMMMPPGAMLKKIEESRVAQLMANGETSTGIAAKQAEIEIETIKFAVGKAIDSRQMAMSAAADYIRAIASAPDSAIRTVNLTDEARARMMSAAASWYGARLDRDKIVLSSKLAELDSRYRVYEHRRNNATQNDEVKVRALGSAADVYARTASAALSSLNSIVSTAANI
jgi:hypothetical protein